MIGPGESFVVRLTPPRAGTFIYHTHLHDYRQLTSGLYGALVVTEADAPFDPAIDHVFVLARREATEASSILQDAATLVIDGERSPRWHWAAARRHRIRLINITPDDVLTVSLLRGETPVAWRRTGKDGAALTGADAETPASVRIAVGETYDFEYDAPPGRSRLWLDVRTTSGKWQAQGEVIVR
jgi:FtsP/CotA-like multicopper oxidase with cupredoxin domain